MKNSRFGIHGSDTNVYDKDGRCVCVLVCKLVKLNYDIQLYKCDYFPPKFYRFVESKFEEIFKKHAHTHKDALTSKEVKNLLKTNREPKDFEGWFVRCFYLTKLFLSG